MIERIGRYEIKGELGRGGFGRVYRAFDPTVGRMVAVKTLTAGGDPDLLVRFRNEAAAAGKLQHKNIVTIFDFGQENGEPFIVMELLEGRDLHRLFTEGVQLGAIDKMRIMAQVAEGLQHAHSKGVVHRDVKPANIMVLPDGSVKIMDFGIALVTHAASTRLTKTGMVPGTLRYMAPEQFRGATNDPLSDIFAFAVTYYELMTSRHPFDAPTQPAVMYNILSADPPRLRDVAPECPEALENVLLRAMTKDRELRYQSFEDMQFDLRPVLLDLARSEAQRRLTEARKLAEAGEVEAAQSALRQALDLDPENHTALQLRRQLQQEHDKALLKPRVEGLLQTGREKLQARQYQEALSALQSVQRLDRTNAEIAPLIEEARTGMRRATRAKELVSEARAAFDQGNFTGAWRGVNEAKETDPANPDIGPLYEAIRQRMEEAERKRQLEEGLKRARAAMAQESYEEALRLLETMEAQLGAIPLIQRAIAECRAARDERSRRDELARSLDAARELIRKRDFAQAINSLEALAKTHPESPEPRNLLSYARDEWETQKRAAEVEKLRAQAEALTAQQRFDDAVRMLEDGIARYSADPVLSRTLKATLTAKAEHARTAVREEAIEKAQSLAAQSRFQDALYSLDAFRGAYGADPSIDKARTAIQKAWEEHQRKEKEKEQSQRRQLDNLAADAGKLAAAHSYDRAIEMLEGAIASHPGERVLADARASALKAKEAYERDQEQRRRQEQIARVLAQVTEFLAKDAFDQASELLERAIGHFGEDPKLIAARNDIFEARHKQERQRKLRAALQTIHEANQLGQLQPALERVEAARRELGDDPDLLRWKSLIEAELERRRRGEAVAQVLSQARVCLGSGDFEKAASILEDGLKRLPGEEDLESLLVDARQRMRARDRARGIEQADTLARAKRYDEALQVVDALRQSFPGDADLSAFRDQIEEARQQNLLHQKRNQAFDELRAIEEEIDRLSDRKKLKEAGRKADRIAARFSGDIELEKTNQRLQALVVDRLASSTVLGRPAIPDTVAQQPASAQPAKSTPILLWGIIAAGLSVVAVGGWLLTRSPEPPPEEPKPQVQTTTPPVQQPQQQPQQQPPPQQQTPTQQTSQQTKPPEPVKPQTTVGKTKEPQQQVTTPPKTDPNAIAAQEQAFDDQRWNAVDKTNEKALLDFASRFPSSRHASAARQAAGKIEADRIAEQTAKSKQELEKLQRAQQQEAQRLEAQKREAQRAEAQKLEAQKREEKALSDNRAKIDQLRVDRNGIFAALSRYSAAFDRKDVAAIKAAYPDIPKSTIDGFQNAFRNRNLRITVSLQPQADPDIKDHVATLICQMSTITVEGARPPPNTPPRRVTVTLSKRGADWVIQNINLQN